MTDDELEIRLSGGYGFAQLERMMSDLRPVLDLQEPRKLRFDMGGLAFIGPASLALLVAAVKRLADGGLIVDDSRMVAPRSPLTNNYLMRMDLFKHLAGIDIDEPFERKTPVGFRPCQHFQGAADYHRVAGTSRTRWWNDVRPTPLPAARFASA